MRSLKILVGAACVALVALTWSAGASADAVCKAKEAPCAGGNRWALETQFEAKLVPKTEFKFTGFRNISCTASSRTDELTLNSGGAGSPAVLEPLSEGFSGCKSVELGACTVTTGELPPTVKWFATPGSPGNGSTGSLSVAGWINFACVGMTCKFLYWETLAHTYTGGSPAIEFLEALYVRSPESHFFCGNEILAKGTREIVSPSSNPVYLSFG
jgi:hypothetical protein